MINSNAVVVVLTLSKIRKNIQEQIPVETVNQIYIYSTVLGAAIKCKQYSEITVESGTHVKSVKITLNIFAVHITTSCCNLILACM